MTLFESTLRLAFGVAALVWLPGWVVSGCSGRPLTILHSSFIGLGLHMAVLVVATTVAERVSVVAVLVVAGTGALTLVAAALRMRHSTVLAAAGAEGAVTLGPTGTGALTAVVVAAAVLRWFHNYHFDDLQHLLYLTEIDRLNTIFPSRFLLPIGGIGASTNALLVSRYPFWGADLAVLARLVHVPAGDAYYVLGLGVLALTFGLITAVLGEITGSRFQAVIGLTAFVVAGRLLSDDFLDYGGYPSQVGKLFVLVAGTSAFAYWRLSRSRYLVYFATAIGIAPLIHTANAIGAGLVIAGVAGALVISRRFWPLAKAVALSVAGLGLIVAMAMTTHGFMRWGAPNAPPPSIRATRAVPQPSASVTMPGVLTPSVRVRFIDPRLRLFASRGAPIELLFVAVVLAAYGGLGRNKSIGLALLTAGVVIVFAESAFALVRQVGTSIWKPGYLTMRASLIRAEPYTHGRLLLTDPITHVLGNAAGWSLPDELRITPDDQFAPLLLFHPAVRDVALSDALSVSRDRLIVVNEGVLGGGTAMKFLPLANVRQVFATGAALPPADDIASGIAEAVRDIYSLEYLDALKIIRVQARTWWEGLLNRPITIFAIGGDNERIDDASKARRLDSVLAALDVGKTDDGDSTARYFLNSVLFASDVPSGCFETARLTFRGTGTFDDVVAIETGQGLRGEQRASFGIVAPGGSTRADVPFSAPVCGPRRVTFFAQTGMYYDMRFRVEAVEWRTAP